MGPITNSVSKCRAAVKASVPVRGRWARRRAHPFGPKIWVLAAAAVCLPAAANASETVGSVSSGNLAISISVAPRYELRSVKAPGSGGVRKDLYSGRLCLATNSSRLAMPIALVGLLARSAVFSDAGLAGDRRRADEAGLGIWQCIQLDRPARSSHMAVDPDIHLLLVRPE